MNRRSITFLDSKRAWLWHKGLVWVVGLIPMLVACVTESSSKLPTALAAEYAPVDLATAAHPCAEILRQLRPLPYHVQIDPQKSNWVTCPGGTDIFIPLNAFEDSYTGPGSSEIDLYISEATNNWETIAYDVAQGMGPGRIPSTLGTVRIQAFADDRDLELKPKHKILVLFPTMPQGWAYGHHGASLPPLLPFFWDYFAPQFSGEWTDDLLQDAALATPYPAFLDYGLADPVTLEFADKVHVVNKVLGKVLAESSDCPPGNSLAERGHKVGFRVNDQGIATQVHVTGNHADCYLQVVEPAMKMFRWDLSNAGNRREWSFSLWEQPIDLPVTSEVSDEAIIHMETLNPLYKGKLQQALAKLADSTLAHRMAQEALVLEQLGWTTIDTGYPIDGQKPLVIDIGDSLKGADAKVWLMLSGMHAVVEVPRDSAGTFTLRELPRNAPGKIVALAYRKNLGAMICIQEWIYDGQNRLEIKLNPITVPEIRKLFLR